MNPRRESLDARALLANTYRYWKMSADVCGDILLSRDESSSRAPFPTGEMELD